MEYSFPIAPHSYFKVLNLKRSREAFLSDPTTEPTFIYPKMLSPTVIQRRLEHVGGDVEARDRLRLVLASANLQTSGPKPTEMEAFRAFNEKLYGRPSKGYAVFILEHIRSRLRPEHEELWQYIDDKLGEFIDNEPRPRRPSRALFLRLRSYLDQYTGGALHDGGGLHDLIDENLEAAGLRQQGWSIDLRDDHSHAQTIHATKKISVGRYYEPRTDLSKRQIVAHEVYGHALRGYSGSVELSEGFATFLEQLTLERFSMKRSLRYLAVALGWGVAGRPMTFSQVYELIWRLMVAMGRYDEARAKSHAYDECARAFRGGRPDMAGAVFLKDSLYFSGNMRVWRYFVNNEVSYEQFVNIIEGKEQPL